MSTRLRLLDQIIRPIVEGLGYECWGIEFLAQGKNSLLRVYVDKDTGILLEDCERVSRQVSSALDVEDPISEEYTLEVSSPGMDRPLYTLDQYQRWVGSVIQVKLRMAFEGRRKFKGILKGVEGEDIVLVVDEHEYLLPLDSIEKANVVPQFE